MYRVAYALWFLEKKWNNEQMNSRKSDGIGVQ
jgi:hypothetical protein